MTTQAQIRVNSSFEIHTEKSVALESRHIISKQEPPPKPMSKEEANLFIRGVAEGWFNLNCGTKDV